MKALKQFLTVSAFIILGTVMTHAQKNDQDKNQNRPKNNPPVVNGPKEPKKPKDNNDKPRDGKKPQGEFFGEFQAVKLFD